MSASTGETELAAKGRPNTMVVQCLVLHDLSGEVVEWFMALVLKTSVGASPPSVRIRPSPLLSPVTDWAFLCLTGSQGSCTASNRRILWPHVSMPPIDAHNFRCD